MIRFSAWVAAIGGFLFGYHTSIISGTLLFIAEQFSLTPLQQGVLASILIFGALIGSLIGGFFADAMGRKKTLFCSVALIFFGGFFLYDAQSFYVLLTGRAIIGMAIGIISVAVPLYIAEISPPEKRGALVSLNQFLVTVGILVSYCVAYLYSSSGDWHAMFNIGLIPAAVQGVCLFFIPETPAWLHRRHIDRPAQSLSSFRSVLVVGIGISIFLQITGINVVVYFAPRILEYASFNTPESALQATLWIGAINVVMTLVGLRLVDRVGRRKLALTGLAGMMISLAILALSFSLPSFIAVLSLMAYISCFAFSMGIVVWLIVSEIFPLQIRGRAMGFAQLASWGSNYIVSLTFLPMVQHIGIASAFWIYSAICLLALIFVYKKVPETKGKTFEQIEAFWQK